MANITLLNQDYANVPDITLPKTGGGTVTFYENGGGGSTLGTKTISENGTYDATDDNLDGYSQVTVQVPAPTLQTKNKSYTPSTSAQTEAVTADNDYDGLEKVNVSVAAIQTETCSVTPSTSAQTLTPSTGKFFSQVNVSAITGMKKVVTGTFTPTQTYNSSGNRKITDTATIGFTPTKFIIEVHNISDANQTQYAILRSSYEKLGNTNFRNTTRYSNTSGSIAVSNNTGAWTTQTNYHLYFNSNNIYIRTASSYILPKDLQYDWIAIE